MAHEDRDDSRAGRARRSAAIAGAAAACLLVVSLMGSRSTPGEALGALLLKLGAMWPALAYLLSGFGLGWPLSRLWRDSCDRIAIQFAVGSAVLLSVSELLGITGLLGPAPAIGVCVLGAVLLATQAILALQRGIRLAPISLAWILGAPAGAVLLVAASMPPGWLWASEYGGYDALSYHLQLPQEWLMAGRITPLEHNVYSFLPGYVEAAFAHLGELTLAPSGSGLLGGDGWRLIACQGLHAGLTLAAAWLTARAAARLAENAGAAPAISRWAGAIAGTFAIATPWAVVTGSLAYNEAGVNAMLAGALLVCAQPRLAPAFRGGLVGLLVGVACGFKPTALFFAGLPAGLALVASSAACHDRSESSSEGHAETPPRGLRPQCRAQTTAPNALPRRIAMALLAGAAVGFIALWPWLFRNYAASGNPVFPFAADLFGPGHWTPDQLARYRAAHAFDGSIADRLRTLLWSSPHALAGADTVERYRGFANPQWGLFLPIVILAAAFLLAKWREARSTTAVLALGLLGQIVAWLAFTHLQSRFLLPALPIGAVLLGLAAARLRVLGDRRPDARAGAALLAGALVFAQTAFLLAIYSSQKNGAPGVALSAFPDALTGEGRDPADSAAAWMRSRPEGDLRVYLVGESAPLYFGPNVVYHTTFDASPIAQLMRAYPDDPAAWSSSLLDRGIGWLIVSPGELDRLQRSGWYDPDVTPDAMRRFAETQGGAELIWQSEGRYLVHVGSAAEPTP
jgi:hypothetical protein